MNPRDDAGHAVGPEDKRTLAQSVRLASTLEQFLNDTSEALNPSNLLERYLHDDAGAHFETYGMNPSDRIISDDLLAVTMLSIEIKFATKSGVDARTVLQLEAHAGALGSLLHQLPDDAPLHELDEATFERLLGADHSPGIRLWRYLRGDRYDGDGARPKDAALKPGIYPVASAKLLARKRPLLLPIIDSVTRKHLLGHGRHEWRVWWLALTNYPDLVAALEDLRADVPGAEHLSVLRVADILTWKRDRTEAV